jgi:hypothetical protein
MKRTRLKTGSKEHASDLWNWWKPSVKLPAD